MCITMIETLKAPDHLECYSFYERCRVLLIGTNDLTACYGILGEYDDERIIDAYRRAIDACRRNGKAIGIGVLCLRQD
jgi:4-hydroxy-2-oxoheptanedioate aldolase